MKPFVGYKKELVSKDELLELIEKFATEPSYYFLRWTHKVSNNWEEKPTGSDFPMIEGQMFNQDCELKWKQKKKDSYEVLLLSIAGKHPDFKIVGECAEGKENEVWRTEDRDAHLYSSTETRFPKAFPAKEKELNIGQRYFIDKQTSTVHFVALTIQK